jgi:osmotically-inducible protein OsmY
MTLDTVSGLVTELLRDEDCQPTEESARAVRDARLASSVEAALVTDARTESVEATAKVEDGRVVITGPYLEEEQQHTVVQVAMRVDGVGEVEYRHGYAPAFAFT